jgi:predicted RNase H-like HicB family nuclease
MAAPVAVPLQLSLDALLHPDADGGYTAEVPALPGCYSEGDTLEAAVANIREAAAAWLAAAHDHATRASQQGAA